MHIPHLATLQSYRANVSTATGGNVKFARTNVHSSRLALPLPPFLCYQKYKKNKIPDSRQIFTVENSSSSRCKYKLAENTQTRRHICINVIYDRARTCTAMAEQSS